MGNREINATNYVFLKDVRYALSRYMSGLKNHGSTVHINSMPYVIAREIESFTNRDGGFNFLNARFYENTITAQKIADKNKDNKFDNNEFEIFKELSKKYGHPVIGGVEISTNSLNSIISISKDNDGKYTLKLYDENNPKILRFSPQDLSKKAKLEIPLSSQQEPVTTNFSLDTEI